MVLVRRLRLVVPGRGRCFAVVVAEWWLSRVLASCRG
jgi:hypothetical protein